jgi:formylglycine-generating enzyme required for sulfatase activity
MKLHRNTRSTLLVLMTSFFISLSAHGGPTVSNVNFSQRAGTKLVDVTYDLAVSGAAPTVALAVSSDGGATFTVPVATVTGAVGADITAGTGKTITWDAGADWAGNLSSTVRVRVVAWDLVGPGTAEFTLIPGGSYQRGNVALTGLPSGDPDITDAAVQTIHISPFYMGKTEVSKEQWDLVKTWGLANGYTDLPAGAGKAADHPVHSISWYAMVKWCNAASEMEGLTPVYYTNDAQTTLYKVGNVDVTNTQVKWIANGYRLPTEAEWEKTARGGVTGKRFPWGDTITHIEANYWSNSGYFYDTSITRFDHPTYKTGATPYTNPLTAFAANAYGVKNLSGNVGEWCWDWYGVYVSEVDSKGSGSGASRIQRGGGWNNQPTSARCAQRDHANPGVTVYDFIGIRLARGRP